MQNQDSLKEKRHFGLVVIDGYLVLLKIRGDAKHYPEKWTIPSVKVNDLEYDIPVLLDQVDKVLGLPPTTSVLYVDDVSEKDVEKNKIINGQAFQIDYSFPIHFSIEKSLFEDIMLIDLLDGNETTANIKFAGTVVKNIVERYMQNLSKARELFIKGNII